MRVAGIPLGVGQVGHTFDPSLTLILLNFTGADGSTTFTDSSPIPYTFTNNGAQISSFEISSGFGSSGLFNNSGSSPYRYIETDTTAPDLRNTDFTIEASIYPTALNFSRNEIIGAQRVNGDLCYALSIGASNGLTANFFGTSITHQNTVLLNSKSHVALVRSGDYFTLYLNGVASSSVFITQTTVNSYNTATTLKVGVGVGGSASFYTGYIDSLRIRQEAVYTGNFTPPTAPFTG